MKIIPLQTGLMIAHDKHGNIQYIDNDKTLEACKKPMIEFEIDTEYNKQIINQLKNIF